MKRKKEIFFALKLKEKGKIGEKIKIENENEKLFDEICRVIAINEGDFLKPFFPGGVGGTYVSPPPPPTRSRPSCLGPKNFVGEGEKGGECVCFSSQS